MKFNILSNFRFRTIFNDHVMAHEGVKPYSCDLCGTRLATKGGMYDHLRKLHIFKHVRKFSCEFCGNTYK